MIDLKTLEKLFQIQFEEGEIGLTQKVITQIVEKQNIFEAFATFMTGKRYSHKTNVSVDTLQLVWTISDKEQYNVCFSADILNKYDITNVISEFVRPRSITMKNARERVLNSKHEETNDSSNL